jgi:2-haloacid dehalogenase
MTEIKALTFDVFGTVVDWRSSVAREAQAILAPKGWRFDWGAFADDWRGLYGPSMRKVSQGERPFVILDVLHRENLLEVLAKHRVEGFTESEVDELNLAWRRLDPWPDVVAGMARLKRRFILAALSNGNIALMVGMAKRAGLPWDVILGAEVARAYKPQPQVYQGAAQMLDLSPAECLMVAAHPSDLKAAAACGLRTAYVHRPLEQGPGREAPRPAAGDFDHVVDDFNALADSLGA